jgi:hypothetical protein
MHRTPSPSHALISSHALFFFAGCLNSGFQFWSWWSLAQKRDVDALGCWFDFRTMAESGPVKEGAAAVPAPAGTEKRGAGASLTRRLQKILGGDGGITARAGGLNDVGSPANFRFFPSVGTFVKFSEQQP